MRDNPFEQVVWSVYTNTMATGVTLSVDRIHCREGHSFSVKDLISSLNLKKTDLLSLYVNGSHLWESCRKSSDWDLVLVVSNKEAEKESSEIDSDTRIRRIKSGKFDVTIIEKNEFLRQLNNHNLCYLIPLWAEGGLRVVRRLDGSKYFQLSREVSRAYIHATDIIIGYDRPLQYQCMCY